MSVRKSVRLILLNKNSKILLFKIENKDLDKSDGRLRKPFWVTPEGRTENGESE